MSVRRRKVGQKRTALYYPTINVPNGPWLRQALLYWDEIASIVPQEWDNTVLIPYSPDIEYLQSEGEFRPIRPETIIEQRPFSEVRELENEFRDIVESEGYQFHLGPKKDWTIDSRVHTDKVSKGLFDYLTEKGLAKSSRKRKESLDWYLFERKTALLYMSLLAKYLADIDPQLTIPSTDREDYRDLVYLAKANTPGFACADILCKNILPVPQEGVSLTDILDFKHRRRTELLRFRALVDQFERDLTSANSIAEVRDVGVRFTESVERGVAELTDVLNDARISTTVGSLRSLVSIKSPTFWSTVSVLAGKATKIADFPIGYSIVGLGIIGFIEIGCHLVDRKNEQRAKLRESAFSYLYYAKLLT